MQVDEPVEVGPDGVVMNGRDAPVERVNVKPMMSAPSPSDGLAPIYEIAGVDSSTYDALPEDVQQQLLSHMHQSPRKRNQSPVGAYLQSERRAKLRKAHAASDFEMQQLHQQLALTQQYTSEVMAMRRDQTKLQARLQKEKAEMALRNEQLLTELQKIDVAKAQIAQSEADVATLAQQYHAQLLALNQQKEQMKHAIKQLAANDARPNFLSPAQPPTTPSSARAMYAKLPQLVTASISDSSSSTVPTEIRLK
ncbi:hypothetical protein ACHAXT_010806 [Thalassiosira profunda]